jgi:hypothetical protein
LLHRLVLLPLGLSLDGSEWTTAGLWLAVVASGIYHGINPGMGWPLAVSAGLLGNGRDGARGPVELLRAMLALAGGHLLAMAGILLPFAFMTMLVEWQRGISIGAALLVIAAGIYLLVNRRHPRFLARIPPVQLTFWSFAVAAAHGAGLMLVPIYLGLCRPAELDAGHQAATMLMGGNAVTALAVSLIHTAAMLAGGGAMALVVYYWLGPAFISRSWFNLEMIWAASLVLVGGIGLLECRVSAC